MNKSESWRQRGNKGEKNREDKDFALTPTVPRPWKGGSSVSPLAPSSKIGCFRKYCYSAGASIGVTYCPLSPLMNGIRSFPIQIMTSFVCLCMSIFYIQTWIYSTCLSLKRLQFTIFCCSVPSSDAVFPRRSEATFQAWPLAMWGPRQGQRGSNARIVLHAQHAFSLRHGTSKRSLISQSWFH